ncbi:MAG: hypothetical protein IKE70_02290 [Bacilli bacterium]|nr:hypothetical protein [Bacilli bacterium]
MSNKNNFCFVGVCKEPFKYSIYPEIGNSLEEIDLYTIQYSNSKDLFSSLKDFNDSFFIFSYHGNQYRTYHVLYENCKGIESITRKFLDKEKNEEDILQIYQEFCYKMKYSSTFQRKMKHQNHDIYLKFIEYFKNQTYSSSYLIHKEGGWILKSYPLIRSVYQALMDDSLFDKEEFYDLKPLFNIFSLDRDDTFNDLEYFNQRIELFQNMREEMIKKNRDVTYYDLMIEKIEKEKRDCCGYQYRK